nr:hypothetical protein [Burkholderia thailandensis]
MRRRRLFRATVDEFLKNRGVVIASLRFAVRGSRFAVRGSRFAVRGSRECDSAARAAFADEGARHPFPLISKVMPCLHPSIANCV